MAGDFTSGVIIGKIMKGEFKGMPKLQMPIVDVREVAMAHLQALKVEDAKNKRFILSSNSLWFVEIAQALKDQYGAFYKIKAKEISYCPMKFASFFSATVKEMLPNWGKPILMDNSSSQKILGIQYRDTKESIIALAECMIENGVIPDKRKKK